MEKGFAAVAEDLTEIKSDIVVMKSDTAGIMSELADIKQRLKAVEEAVSDHSGYSKEIDLAFERIAAIEKHLGIKHPAHHVYTRFIVDQRRRNNIEYKATDAAGNTGEAVGTVHIVAPTPQESAPFEPTM